MAKEKKIVNIAKDDVKSAEVYGKDKHGKIIQLEEKGDRKGRATSKRILAFLFWAIGIFFEVVAILRLNNIINWLPKIEVLPFMIGCLVIDCIAVIIGSMLWKKANHIDPASEANPTRFWIHNNLGTIVSVIAFLPFIIFVLTNKDLDGKSKSIATVIGVVLLAIAGLSSYDWNPVSSEQLLRAEQEVQAVSETGKVYWAPTSKKYHVDPDCPAFSQSETVYEGTVKQAFENNLTDPCRRCIPELHDHDHDGE
jgi:uncharacterized membrane protein YidH (DUF202 family)